MRRSLLAVVWAGRPARPSRRPEVSPILPLCGKSILRWGLEKAAGLRPKRVFVVGAPGSIREEVQGHADAVGFLASDEAGGVLEKILSAEKPRAGGEKIDLLILDPRLVLISASTLRGFVGRHREEGNAATLLASSTSEDAKRRRGKHPPEDPWDALLIRVEELSAVLSGSARGKDLSGQLSSVLGTFAGQRKKTGAVILPEAEERLAVRTPEDASRVRTYLHEQKCLRLEQRGVIILDRAATWIDWDVRIGPGTIIHPAVVIQGRSVIGKDCRVYPFVHLLDARIGSRVEILSSTVIDGGRIGRGARVGPFTHFRPGTIVKAGARVGNFVEMKNTVFGRRSLASHLSYLGDAAVGDDVNIGAGTITCNFDRFQKNPTAIGRGAFIGSGTELVAPVKVGRHAVIGAGSTITKNVSPWALAVARGRQIEIKNWAKRKLRK
jgi:bifunctional UDP-N-acetylglucosamine pyrophosphorylase/glucosamine-1-phosphate N-acetyltransferase